MLPQAGQVFYVQDKDVAMPPEDYRNTHPQRTVLVVSGNDYNADES